MKKHYNASENLYGTGDKQGCPYAPAQRHESVEGALQ
jgi:hypothetical protein